MIVLKFGGTSVGTSESLANVKKIVEDLKEDAIVIVSALGGLTDCLISTAQKSADGNYDFFEDWTTIADRHYNIIKDVISEGKASSTTLKIIPLLDELKRLYKGVSLISYLPENTLARIVSLGERMSSIIVADMIEGASHADSLEIIKTEKWFDKNIASVGLTNQLIKDNLGGKTYPIVMGGFISTDKDTHEITNLGRGGSDYTAALVAAALDADVLQIWTDVDGFLTTDPRIVKDARVINEMSFVESMDLCTFGSKVVYPPTIYPVFHKNIPIRILNTHNPEAEGTLICEKPNRTGEEDKPIVGLSALKNLSLITIKGKYLPSNPEATSRIFNSLSRKGLKAIMKSDYNDLEIYSFVISTPEAKTAVNLLNEEFAPELAVKTITEINLSDGMAVIAAVGDNIKLSPDLANRIENILESEGINVYAKSKKVSETTLAYLIKEDNTSEALQLLHSRLF